MYSNKESKPTYTFTSGFKLGTLYLNQYVSTRYIEHTGLLAKGVQYYTDLLLFHMKGFDSIAIKCLTAFWIAKTSNTIKHNV